ncbi:lysoplasmalogenase [Microbacterium esteraromaticum]|uniref:Lysoplasmalogenase n=1 Tax=Microbacterium esteraromaticum TaxID=57043 RepID=A0A939IW38_9MICO|nr:lysoplasmalogenase [Microbacterium esteraromaticum]MBN8207096.1 lysoplasmalogenase [Microbacterium esteraromaticum]MBN8417250.1 lysoplasmalogenase [Microbacterium esteraromaticum]
MLRSIRPLDIAVWAPYIVLAIIHVTALTLQSPLAAPTKLTLMPLLALPVLAAAPRLRPRGTIALLGAALLFSWLGDGAGTFFPSGPELPLMLLFFGLAHIAYIVLFLRYTAGRRLPWWTLVYAAWWVGMLVVVGPQSDGLLLGIAAYGLVLAGTAATAARGNPTLAVGGAFFLLSDSILAFRLFLDGMPNWTSPAVMFTYTLGQGLIIAGALHRLRNAPAPRNIPTGRTTAPLREETSR